MRPQVNAGDSGKKSSVTLKTVAERAGVTPGTVSAVLNNSAASRAFPENTKNRILAVARELNYRPNFLARSLRVKRTYTIGVISEEIGDPYGAMVISGIESYLRQRGYFFLTVAHRHDQELLESYAHLLLQRGVEGFITVDTSLRETPTLPTVAIAGHRQVPEVTNLILDHKMAARMALEHLAELGHEEIAFIRGPATSSDSEDRWRTIVEVTQELGIQIRPELTVRPEGEAGSPDIGHLSAKKLLSRKRPFTALFCYNDSFAIGAIRAIQEAGLRAPADISVVGFDDISAAAYCNPSITTVRQPLRKMGELAAKILVGRIENGEAYVPEIAVKPEFVVRQSTARARGLRLEKEQVPTPIRVND
jgi:DNA-binding LacI/PurR family transcriptional regulator